MTTKPEDVASAVRLLVAAVRESKTARQKETTLAQRAAFVGCEWGEVQRELLCRDGAYGKASQGLAVDRLPREIADLLWNVLDLSALADADLAGAFAALLPRNLTRQWPQDAE